VLRRARRSHQRALGTTARGVEPSRSLPWCLEVKAVTRPEVRALQYGVGPAPLCREQTDRKRELAAPLQPPCASATRHQATQSHGRPSHRVAASLNRCVTESLRRCVAASLSRRVAGRLRLSSGGQVFKRDIPDRNVEWRDMSRRMSDSLGCRATESQATGSLRCWGVTETRGHGVAVRWWAGIQAWYSRSECRVERHVPAMPRLRWWSR
jgi:hypothetical protein